MVITTTANPKISSTARLLESSDGNEEGKNPARSACYEEIPDSPR